MIKSIKQGRIAFLVVSACVAFCGTAFAKAKSPEMVKQEAGYYYGYAKGDTAEAASAEAKRDLVSNALTGTLRIQNPKAPSVKVSAESANARLPDLKPYLQTKPNVSEPAVTYRMKIADWDKEQKAYEDALRTKISSDVAALQAKHTAAQKISAAVAILTKLADEGETDLLTAQAGGTELVSRRVEAVCVDAVKGLVLTVSIPEGVITPDSQFSVKAADASGNAVADLTLCAVWDTPDLPTDAAVETPNEVRSIIKTDALGNASIDYPVAAEYHNRPVTLTVSTNFAESIRTNAALRKLDASTAVEFYYAQYDDIKNAFPTVTVPAGKFNAGAVAQDTRAVKREASHEATTGSYTIDTGLVTNARYAAYLHATHAEVLPEYFDNADYNKGNQPVIGVSAKDAEAYAAWLSAQTGNTYRLPTEEEWEKAARAGQETIYPWGDDSPAESKKANYKGNGQFNGPSPIGSFESGKNAWGITDMAGNVWEWTSSARTSDPASTLRIVKGGSWMDGPTDLRISNSREVESDKGYPDVGFRLIMEVSK